MEKEKEIHSCVDCGTQNCKYKDRTYPDFCLTTNLKEEDRQCGSGIRRVLPMDTRTGNHGVCT